MTLPTDSAPAPLVLVVDDDAAVRDSLALLLRSAGYAAAVRPSSEALLASLPAEAGCLIADIRMPGGMDGIALLDTLRQRGQQLPTIVVTGHGDVPLAVRAMKAGATDFIEKPYEDTAILDAVAAALASRPALNSARAEALRRVATLSPREREVLEGLVAGKLNKTIAHELGISPRTVEVHRANVMEKLSTGSLSGTVRLALQAGIGT